MQRRVWSWQGGGGAGRHNQALPVARPTAPEEGVSSLVNRGRQRAVRGTEGGGGGGQGGEGDDGGLSDGGMKGSGGQQVLEEAAVAVATQLSRRPDLEVEAWSSRSLLPPLHLVSQDRRLERNLC